MHEILLVRHAQTDWNVEKRIMGAQPVALNARGVLQAYKLAEFLRSHPIQALYSSPHERALQTAAVIAKGRELSVIPEIQLREIEHGKWVGKTFAEIRALPGYKPYYESPEISMGEVGESLLQVQERGVQFVESLRRQDPGPYVLVSHADWIKCVLMHYLRMPLIHLSKFRIDNASISYLHFTKKHERVICINYGVDPSFTLSPEERGLG